MLPDTLNSLKDSLLEKTKNPFLGTYVLVYVIRKWEAIFSLFHFDVGMDLNSKIRTFSGYLQGYDIWVDILVNAGWTIVLLLVTYLCINIGMLITRLYKNLLTPLVYKLTDPKSVVTIEEYNKMEEKFESLRQLFNEESKKRKALQDVVDNIQSKESDNKNDLGKTSSDILNLNESPDTVRQIWNYLLKQELIEIFAKTANSIRKGQSIKSNNDTTEEFIKLGLIQHQDGGSLLGYDNFSLTALGDVVYTRIVLRDYISDDTDAGSLP